MSANTNNEVTVPLAIIATPTVSSSSASSSGTMTASGTTTASTPTPAGSTLTVVTPQTPLASTVVPGGDTSENRKFYTISVALREIYDTNIFTANTGRIASFETQISPSILFDFPHENNDFSLRETFTSTFYSNRPGDPWDFSNEVVAQYQHSFSDRYNLSMSDQFGYYTEPSLFENVGTLYYNGSYISNTFNGTFNAQWTPLVSTLFTYANTVVDYENASTAQGQNSVENTGSATVGFAILPKINLTFGGIVDNIDYTQYARGYTTLTGNTGVNWQALPSLLVNAAVGGSVTETDEGASQPSPYASLGVNWQLGERSLWTFSYVHEVVPTDVVQAMGQVADRFSTLFRYNITHKLTAHLEGAFTHGVYTPWLISSNTISGFSENDFAIDAGLSYHINDHFEVNVGDTFSGVASGLTFRDYTRDQAYVGVRGTY